MCTRQVHSVITNKTNIENTYKLTMHVHHACKEETKMIRMPIQQMIPYHHQYPRNTETNAPKKENENTQGLSFHEILQQKMAKKNVSMNMR